MDPQIVLWMQCQAKCVYEYNNNNNNNNNKPRSDKRNLPAIKVKSEIFTRKKNLDVVNNYTKFEEIIFTNNKNMNV